MKEICYFRKTDILTGYIREICLKLTKWPKMAKNGQKWAFFDPPKKWGGAPKFSRRKPGKHVPFLGGTRLKSL